MSESSQRLIVQYCNKGILLDTNLLLLLLVGFADPLLVGDFKRTRNQQFAETEFSLLEGIVKMFSKIVTTPHILAETSNFIFQLDDKKRPMVLKIAKDAIQSFKERRPESKNLVQSDYFLRFGLTDSSVLDLPPKSYLVLSVDAGLVIALQKKGVDAINFNHLRQLNWEQ